MKTNTMRALAVSAAFLAAGTVAEARTLRLAFGAPSGSVWETQLLQFIKDVEGAGVDLKIDYFPDSQLGNLPDTLKATISGRIDIWVGSLPTLTAMVPEVSALTLPFLFDDDAQAKCAVPKIEEPLREVIGKKVQLLHLSHTSTQDVSAPKPVRVPSDISGMKMRVGPLEGSIAMFRAAGATVVSVPTAETPAALETGLVQAVDFEATIYVNTGAYKTAKYHTQLNFNHNLGAFLVGPRTWASLSDAEKKALTDAASHMDYGRSLDAVNAIEGKVLERATKGGAEIIAVTDDERAQWKQLGRSVWPGVVAASRGQTGPLLEQVEAIKAQCPANNG